MNHIVVNVTERGLLAAHLVYLFEYFAAMVGRTRALLHPMVQRARASYREAFANG